MEAAMDHEYFSEAFAAAQDDTKRADERKAYADGLRAVAAFYEAHPEIPLPGAHVDNYAVNTKDDAANVMRALGSCNKHYADEMFTISKAFGAIEAKFVFYRDSVCTRKVVGVETIPAVFVEAHTIPATTKEIVEWECEPVLAPKED